MTNTVSTMRPFVNAVGALLEGTDNGNSNSNLAYFAFEGLNENVLRAAGGAAADHDRDGIVLLFEPGRCDAGPARLGVSFVDGGAIRLQIGELWLGLESDQAVLVPRGVGKRFGHFAIAGGRIVQRKGWPAADLAAGKERAKRRLAELAAELAEYKP